MGYELNKLLEHYGLNSPTISNYSGSTNEDKSAYDAYVQSYKDRLKNTSMYGQKFSGDKLNAPTFATPAATTTPAASTSAPSAPVPYIAPSGGLLGSAINTGVNTGAIFPVNNTLTNASPTLFSGMFGGGILSGMNSGILGMYRAKGGSIDTAAEKNKLVKKYGFGGTVEGDSVDPMTLRYYNPQPDPLAPIEPEVSAGQTPTQVQTYDDYPNEIDMLSSKAQAPAMYQQEETAAPVTPTAAPSTRSETFEKILKQYFPQTDTYNKELEDARRQAKLESDAFTKMIEASIKNPEQDNLSKAEMYFRLAAAFGSPTKTKQGFMENLGAAGQQLAEYSKGARADQAAKNALRVEAQKIKMQGAKEDLATVRALAGKEMDERKAVGLKLIEEYVKSGEAKSTAGKQAQDEGYKPGTPGFQRRTEEIGNFNIQKGLEQLGLQKQQVEIAMSNLGLKSQQQSQQNTRLSSSEMKMKLDSEKNIQSYQQAMANLDTAYRLNPNTYTGGITDWLKSIPGKWGANDPTYINTKQLDNLLGSQAVEQLRATFAGSPTEGERAVLMELQGIGAKSKEERKRIILNTYKALKKRLEKETDRLQRINSREFATSDNTPDAE